VEQEEIEVVESTPVKRGEVVGELPDFAASPVVTVQTEETSYEVTTTSSTGKTKKTKRRTHKKTQEVDGDDGGQVF